MVHTYECLGRFFLLDVESGSVFEIDELTFLLVKKRISPKESPLGDFSSSSAGKNHTQNQADVAKLGKNRNKASTAKVDIVANSKLSPSSQSEIDGKLSLYSQGEIEEAESEIDALISEGVLFSKRAPLSRASSSGVIKAMCLNITHDCNLRCTYCFADGGSYKGARAHMSLSTAKAAVDFLISHSGNRRNLEVDFFGGEPVMNFGVIKDTVAYAKERGAKSGKNFRFTVTTNALLLTSEHIDFFNSEMYNVVLSIDGRKEVHDRHRITAGGKGSFDTVLKNALCFKNQRTGQYYVRGTFTAKNLDFASDVLELNDLGFDQISVEPVVLADSDPLCLKEEHLPTIYSEYERLAAEYLRRRKNGQDLSFFHFNIDLGDDSLCETKRLKGCGAGCEYIAVAPSGDIYPCHQFDGEADYRMGSVFSGEVDGRIASIFDKSSVLSKPECSDCWAKYYCSGGCNAANIKYAGGIDNVCSIACKIMKKRLECAIAVGSIEKSGS